MRDGAAGRGSIMNRALLSFGDRFPYDKRFPYVGIRGDASFLGKCVRAPRAMNSATAEACYGIRGQQVKELGQVKLPEVIIKFRRPARLVLQPV